MQEVQQLYFMFTGIEICLSLEIIIKNVTKKACFCIIQIQIDYIGQKSIKFDGIYKLINERLKRNPL